MVAPLWKTERHQLGLGLSTKRRCFPTLHRFRFVACFRRSETLIFQRTLLNLSSIFPYPSHHQLPPKPVYIRVCTVAAWLNCACLCGNSCGSVSVQSQGDGDTVKSRRVIKQGDVWESKLSYGEFH